MITNEVKIIRGENGDRPPRMTQIPIGGFGIILDGNCYKGLAVFRVNQDRFYILNGLTNEGVVDHFDQRAAQHYSVEIAKSGDCIQIRMKP